MVSSILKTIDTDQNIYKFNIVQNMNLINTLGISNVPTLIKFNNQEEILSTVGMITKKEFKEVFE